MTSDEEALNIIHTGKLANGAAWDPLQTALVGQATAAKLDPATCSGTADVTRHEPNRIEVKTQAETPSILVLSENHYPGWNAYVDGAAVETLRVDYNLRGVVLAAGNHRVAFIYRPKSVIVGLVISLLTLACLIGWLRMGSRLEKAA